MLLLLGLTRRAELNGVEFWASDQGARWSLIYGAAEDEAGTVTVRDMTTGEQTQVPAGEVGDYLARLAAEG